MSTDRELRAELEKQQARLRTLHDDDRVAELEAEKNELEAAVDPLKARVAALEREHDAARTVHQGLAVHVESLEQDRRASRTSSNAGAFGAVLGVLSLIPMWIMVHPLLAAAPTDRLIVWALSSAVPLFGGWLWGSKLLRAQRKLSIDLRLAADLKESQPVSPVGNTGPQGTGPSAQPVGQRPSGR